MIKSDSKDVSFCFFFLLIFSWLSFLLNVCTFGGTWIRKILASKMNGMLNCRKFLVARRNRVKNFSRNQRKKCAKNVVQLVRFRLGWFQWIFGVRCVFLLGGELRLLWVGRLSGMILKRMGDFLNFNQKVWSKFF